MENRSLHVVLMLFVLLTACEFDAVLKPKDYPQLETLEPVSDSTGVLFRAVVKNRGSKPFLKYGFAWGLGFEPTVEQTSALMDGDVATDTFSLKVVDDLFEIDYRVRAYVATEDYESYGKAFHFNNVFTSKITVTDFTPKSGYSGDSIVIVGRNLTLTGQTTKVFMGEFQLQIVSSSSNRLVVLVPQYNGPKSLPITVRISTQSVVTTSFFEAKYNWTRKNDFSLIEGYAPVSFYNDKRGYLIHRGTNSLWVYESSTDKWSWQGLPMSSGGLSIPIYSDSLQAYLPPTETELLAFSAGSKAYVFLSGAFWEFNTLTNVWTRKAVFPGVLEGEIKWVFGAFVQGKLYVGNCGNNQTLWEYDPNLDRWTRKADFSNQYPNYNIAGNTVFTIQNKLYLAATTVNGFCKLYVYDPSSNVWSPKGNLPYLPFYGQACFVIDEVAYVGMGFALNSDYLHLIKYDVTTDTWKNCLLHSELGNTIVSAVYVFNGKANWIVPNYWDTKKYENWEYEPRPN